SALRPLIRAPLVGNASLLTRPRTRVLLDVDGDTRATCLFDHRMGVLEVHLAKAWAVLAAADYPIHTVHVVSEVKPTEQRFRRDAAKTRFRGWGVYVVWVVLAPDRRPRPHAPHHPRRN